MFHELLIAPFLIALPFALPFAPREPVRSDLLAPRPNELQDDPQGLTIDRGELGLDLFIPSNEVLEYDVVLDVAILGDTDVGDFTLSAGTGAYHSRLPAIGEAVIDEGRIGWIRAHAEGSYLGYTLDHEIVARHLPKEWPRTVYRTTQRGTENKRRELMYGIRGGAPAAWYRSDRHCKKCKRREHFVDGGLFSDERHCKKCKRAEHRIWKDPVTHEIPGGAVDMLSAIHLARALVRNGAEATSFPLLDDDEVWDVTLTRADRKKIETLAGDFWCRAIKLDPRAPEGEERAEKFKGLFGIHGTLSIWLEERTGVPVVIEGIVPVGPFDIDVSLRLSKASGTPPEFAEAK